MQKCSSDLSQEVINNKECIFSDHHEDSKTSLYSSDNS